MADARKTRPLRIPRVRLSLIQDLAEGKLTLVQLGEKYGVTSMAIHHFKTDFAEEIEGIRSKAIDMLSLLWVTDKAKRLATYQRSLDLIENTIEKAAEEDGTITPETAALLKEQARALRFAAEEMGALPSRTQIVVENKSVDYTVNGVDPSEFQ
jgi:hypothetical protein